MSYKTVLANREEIDMKRAKYILIIVVAASLSSCGIFKKDCGCPHFGKNIPVQSKPGTGRYA
jgi:hypothetical protein